MLAIGLMSGTSLDGIDGVLVNIEDLSNKFKVETIASLVMPFDMNLKTHIEQAMNLKANAKDLSSLNVALGHAFANAALAIIKKAQKRTDDIAYIASHGQTIWHIGMPENGYFCSTMQLGEPAVIAQITGIKTIANFRSADMAVGGQGAPLVPFADYKLFRHQTFNRALHNLGGISNLTILKADGKISDIIAFDTGPANVMINEACEYLLGIPFDDNGDIAASGQVNIEMYDEVMRHPYFKIKPPKSTGREMFGQSYTRKLLDKYKHLDVKDIFATLTEIVAVSIKKAYEEFIFPNIKIDEIICSGGGVDNRYLMTLLKSKMPDVNITISDQYGIDHNDKEAIAFAILGYETLHHRPSNVPNATGAKKQVILGSIHEV